MFSLWRSAGKTSGMASETQKILETLKSIEVRLTRIEQKVNQIASFKQSEGRGANHANTRPMTEQRARELGVVDDVSDPVEDRPSGDSVSRLRSLRSRP